MSKNQREAIKSAVSFASNGRKVYVVSDLHMAAGLNRNGNYEGTENFYYDDSFIRFLNHLQSDLPPEGAILVINGDFVDFTRITTIPEMEEDFRSWQKALDSAGIIKSIEDLRSSIVKKELAYGLKTNDYKSVWKMMVCIEGHRPLFERLARWVEDGNEVVIVKGNHDLEWYWPAVQRYLCTALQNMLQGESQKLHLVHTERKRENETSIVTSDRVSPPIALPPKQLAPRIHFVDDAMQIDNRIHIEHGHKHERTTAVVGDPTLNKGEELNYPFGSFFNRYLINRLELSYPFLDNVRPSQNILPVLIRERFPLAIKVLFRYIPFMFLIIPKKIYWHTFKYFLNILFILVLPVLITLYALYKTISGGGSISTAGIPGFVLNILQSFGFLFLSYIAGRIMAMAGLKSPATLSKPAEEIVQENPSVEVVLFGHSHNPEQRLIGGNKWYFNTGTWIPVFEISSADVRMDRTYTFIAIDCAGQEPCTAKLQRWNDDAQRIDSMVLNDKI